MPGRTTIAVMSVCIFVLGLAIAASAGSASQAADRVTGYVTWFDANAEVMRSAKFDAHDEVVMRNGNIRPARGSMVQTAHFPDGGEWFEVAIKCVNVQDASAMFAGEIVAASDGHLNRLGLGYLTEVYDAGSPANGTSQIVNWIHPDKTVEDWCEYVDAGTSPGGPEHLRDVTVGNLTIHSN